jgi:hypothetical protein
MGIIGMKVPSRGRLLSNWPAVGAYARGKAQAGPLSMKEALYYVLSLPVSTVIIGCDNVAQLEENVKLARDFTPLSDQQLASLSGRTAPIAQQALFFRRWS